MRAVVLHDFDSGPTLSELPTPDTGANELLVRVHASSVNPVDAAIAAGMLKGMVDYAFPVTLGRDFAGVVEAVGPAVSRYQPGDEVFGFLLHADPTVHAGSWADYLVVPEDLQVARKPDGVDAEAAGAAPLAAITALAALDALEPASGSTVLVVGATGGVGSFFVQLAAATGATVIAPGLPEDRDYLLGLGAAEVPDRGSDLGVYVREHHPAGVAALLDVVGSPDTTLLEPGGRIASPIGAAGDGPGRANLMASPSVENLKRLARLLADGTLRVPIQETYLLGQAAAALHALPATHTQGKLGIKLA
ncbi:MAG: NADPH:quinone reductase [Gaiellaceae bacterium]|jgi:NADPH2:quinone reductase|nr:NADPH:quinone reductase [Gaiellaceae bacterium]